MKVYRILHKPTGLYYSPDTGYGNLSITGKFYARNPKKCSTIRIKLFKWNDTKITKKQRILIDYFKIEPNERGIYYFDKCFAVPETDWEIIEL
jgi:hypothetical protein